MSTEERVERQMMSVARPSSPSAPEDSTHAPSAHVAVRDLVVLYGDVSAVKGVSFDIYPGQTVTLLGPSGCGKTSTLRAVAGLERPEDGEISIADRLVFSKRRRVNVPAERRGLSMVFQSYAIWPHMTVFENVAYGLRARRAGRREVEEKTRWALELVHLAHLAERGASLLSGGQQQRVALARSVAFGPALLLLDEPLSNLDAKLRAEMRAEIRELVRRLGMTALYVTHDQEEALTLSDRIIVMREGSIEQVGSPAEIFNRPVSGYVADFVGSANLIEGRVRREMSEPGLIAVGLVDGAVLYAAADRPHEPDTITVAIRPSHLRLSRDRQGGRNSWQTKVLRHTFLGDLHEYVVELGGASVTVRSSVLDDLREGEDAVVEIEPRRCVIVGP